MTHNEAAKVALSSFRNVDLFIVDYTASERTRKEMVGWLKANCPKVKIIALNPSKDQLIGADYNVVLNDHDEWLSLLAAAAGSFGVATERCQHCKAWHELTRTFRGGSEGQT